MSVFKVSKPGIDAFNATPEQSQIHDQYPPLRIEENKWGILTYTFQNDPPGNAGFNMFAINHGYPFIPAGLVYYQDPQINNRYAIITTPYNVNDFGWQYLDAWITPTQLIVRYENLAANNVEGHLNMQGRTYRFKYYIFAEQGA
jgi:hypothetical protein